MTIAHAERVQIKLFAKNPPPTAELIGVFHGWITHKKIDDELLIDVADYTHVPQGPGVLLVGHGSDYYFDEHDGRPGILYSRKRAFAGDLRARLIDGLRRALYAAALLGNDANIEFGTEELLVRVPDRLHAPKDEASYAELSELVKDTITQLFGDIERIETEPLEALGEPLGLRVRLVGAPQLESLRTRLH